MFKRILSFVRGGGLGGFSSQLKQLNKQISVKAALPHALIALADDVVKPVIVNRSSLKEEFEQANKKLWLIAQAVDETLESRDFEFNKQDDHGNTMLHRLGLLCQAACNEGPGLSSWENLDKKPGYEGFTLSAPIAYMFVKLVQKIDVNLQNVDGDTVLHLIATATEQKLGFNAHTLLLSKDARTDLENNDGFTCLLIARNYSIEADLLNYFSMFRMSEKLWRQVASDKINEILQTKEKYLQVIAGPGPSLRCDILNLGL